MSDKLLKGIDVSVHNSKIDWNKVKEAGVDFAIIKATQGRSVTGSDYLFMDSRFKENIVGAHASGIACGVYHYLTAKTVAESNKEANYFLSVIAPYKAKISLFVAVDVEEDKYLPPQKGLLTTIVTTFCQRIKSAGYKPIIYTNPNYIKNRLHDLSNWDLWLALWRDKSNLPQGYPNLKIWQYGAESKVDGIAGNVDANIGFFDAFQKRSTDEYILLFAKACGYDADTIQLMRDFHHPYANDYWRKAWEATQK